MQLDPTKSAIQNLLNLVVSLNPNGPTSPNQVTVGNPIVFTDPSDAIVNTQIVLTAVAEQGFTGDITLEYARFSPGAQMVAVGRPAINVPRGSTDVEILALVNATFLLIPGEGNFDTSPVRPTTFPNTSVTHYVPNTDSIIYLPGNYGYQLTWE